MKTKWLVYSLLITICIRVGWANGQDTIYVSRDGVCSGNNPCYSTIQDAIDSVSLPSIIKITEETYYEDVVLDMNQVIDLEGGWDTSFTSCSSYTVISGSMMMSDGTMIIGGTGRIILLTPPPTINSFTANPGVIDFGQSSTLSWSITSATSASIDQGIGSVNSTGGSIDVSPATTTAYTLTASNAMGSDMAQVTVNVIPNTPPTINNFSANPETINPGENSTLSWNITNATSASIDMGVGSVDPATGSTSVSPPSNTTYTLTATNGAGPSTAQVTVIVSGTLPPDPNTVAPPVDRTVSTDINTATSFLYGGYPPIQTGVAPGAIEPRRTAVLRGKVLDKNNDPLPGVTITILNHPEYGQTLSRLDGMFDMAVNGGGLLTVNYQKPSYLPAQRQVNLPWQDYAWLPDVVLLMKDTQVTSVDLNANIPIQIARGSLVTDSDGARQATLLISQGTQAQLVMPDGSTQPITALNIRATEYTIGANGPKAMPGLLPPQSGYTYAVDLSADEAISAGAKSLGFNQPIFHYVENFLNFPVGGIVPVGYYDRDRAAWIPSDNGRVIQIVSIVGALAELDTDGDGLVDNGVPLGVTEAERQKLALLYTAGQSLWRVPITHFSPWDCNWPYGLPDGAGGPGGGPPGGGAGGGGGGGMGGRDRNEDDDDDDKDGKCEDECCGPGSIIGCQSQTLGEAVRLIGTRFRLHYESDRSHGYKADYTLRIPLSSSSVPDSLLRIDLEILVAGRLFTETFLPAPNQTHIFTWDGQDVYGRTLQGDQPVTVRIGYVYPAVYRTPAENDQAFAQYGEAIIATPSRQEIALWQQWILSIGNWDVRARGLGGWNLNVHHAYAPLNQTLYLGNGSRRSATGRTPLVIMTVAGSGLQVYSGDGGPATQANLYGPRGVAVGPDGSLYIADTFNNRIRRVGLDGIIITVAGNGSPSFSGDGGPATAAGLQLPYAVAVGPDGSLYITGPITNRVRRVGPDGIINTVAGNGIKGYAGDGGPATQALLSAPYSVALAPDGSLYISDMGNFRIRRVSPDGIINTVAGNGIQGYAGDGGPAAAAKLNVPYSAAVGPDGSLYIADAFNNRIRRVSPDGIINTVAGNGIQGYAGDGGLATQALLSAPYYVAVGPDGSLYFSNTQFSGIGPTDRIRRVSPDGIINTVAGNGTAGFSGDGGPAAAAHLRLPSGVALGPDGKLYIADTYNNRIRQVASAIPGLVVSDTIIPSENNSLLYVFDGQSRHRRTLDALTGVVRYQFGYDDAGRLASVTDRDSNVTTIEHDGAGNPTAIVGPFGQRTTLAVDAHGYLSRITNPAGESAQLAYSAEGLLTSLTDPRGNLSSFTYDTLGRLIRDDDPAGGFKKLSRVEEGQDYTVTLSTASGRTTTYRVENLPEGGQRRVNTFPSGLQAEWVLGADGAITTRFADGTVKSLALGPDPRWGMLAPVAKTSTITTPGGLSSTVETTRSMTLADPYNPMSLTALTETTRFNGRTYTTFYDAITKQKTMTTPAGRQVSSTLDDQGRFLQLQADGLFAPSYSYDARGRLATATMGTEPDTRSITFTYNPKGYIDTVTDPLGRILSLQYDDAGRVMQQTLPDGRAIQLAYDANGNVRTVKPPGRPDHTFAYTPVDLTSEYSPPDVNAGSDQTVYTYNLDRQLTLIARPDGQTIDLSYDAAGRPSTTTLPRGQVVKDYNEATGRVASITAPEGLILSYTYDGPLLTGETWAGEIAGNITRTYDNNFRLATQSVNGGNTVAYSYDADGLLTQAGDLILIRNPQNRLLTGATLGNVADAWTYNGFGERTTYTAAYSGGNIFTQQYTLDKLGRIIQKTETIGGVIDTYDYTYNLGGRLTDVRKNGVLFAAYTYDDNDNRFSVDRSGSVTTYTYDLQDRLLTQSSALGTQSYSYSVNGELTSKTADGQTTTYSYDALGNLMAVTLPDGTQIDYLVDGWNRRIGKKVNGVVVQGFLYQGRLRIVAELDEANGVVSRFVYAGSPNMPAYMVKGGLIYRIIKDHIGSPRLVVNVATGEVAQRMDYDEFGNVTNDTNPGFQPFGFAGGLYDSHTGFVRFGARDYDGETGRWTAKDPILFAGGNMNLYGYVFADPVNFIDPTGRQFEWMNEVIESILSNIRVDPDPWFEIEPPPPPPPCEFRQKPSEPFYVQKDRKGCNKGEIDLGPNPGFGICAEPIPTVPASCPRGEELLGGDDPFCTPIIDYL